MVVCTHRVGKAARVARRYPTAPPEVLLKPPARTTIPDPSSIEEEGRSLAGMDAFRG